MFGRILTAKIRVVKRVIKCFYVQQDTGTIAVMCERILSPDMSA